MERIPSGPGRHALSGPVRQGVFSTTNPLASGFRAGRILGKAADITRRDLIRLAAEHDIANAPATIGRVIDTVSRWMEHAGNHGIPKTTASMVAAQHRLTL